MRHADSTGPRGNADGCFSILPLKVGTSLRLTKELPGRGERGSRSVTSAPDERDSLRSEAIDWLMRIQASPRDAALRAALEGWLAESDSRCDAYRSVEKVWRLTGELPAAIPQVASTVPTRMSRMRRNAAISMTALAACAALYFLPVLQLRFAADHMTDIGELRELKLDDGSVVNLNAASAIALRHADARREIELLTGQAFFQVAPAHNRPFVVIAGDVTVIVTGTAFDVRTSYDSVSVAVQSGTVDVARAGGAATRLTSGERLTIARSGAVAKSTVAPDDVAAWRERRLVVDGATLGEVVEELDRHHPGAIVLSDRALAARRVTGIFDLTRPVEALRTVVATQRGSVIELTRYLIVVSGP